MLRKGRIPGALSRRLPRATPRSARLAQVIIQSTKRPGEIHIQAVKDGWDGPELMPAKLVIKTKQVEFRPSVPAVENGQ